ncbi:MAG TPA: MraY family glycosyltransferase [Acidimicrobiales bacterium]|nr:MraY family glycosyltransferase [Acidimicrobiales bacterium]
MPTTNAYVAAFVIALVVTFVATPLVKRAAFRLKVVAIPSDRSMHEKPMPLLGGAAMLIGFLAAMGVAWVTGAFPAMFEDQFPTIIGVVVGAVVLCAIGTLDDVRDVSAPAKTAGIVLAASVMYLFGVTMLYFRPPFLDGLFVVPEDLAPLITVLWVLGMANAVNLIDGLDGLAAGIVAIGSGAFFLYGHHLATAGVQIIEPSNPSPLICVVTAGICLGFLPHNFNPARIFMGDGGALMLGGLMAASTILVGGQTSQPFSGQVFFFFAPLFIPFFVMAIPIIDTAFAIIRRARKRAGLAEADKDHLHHRLMRLGHGQRRSVAILWLWSGLLSLFVLYPVYTGKGNGLVPIAVAALALILLTFFHPGTRRARQQEAAEEEHRRLQQIAEADTEPVGDDAVEVPADDLDPVDATADPGAS